MAKKSKPEPKAPKPRKPPYPGEPPHTPEHPHRHKRHTLRTVLELVMALSQSVSDALNAQDQKLAALATKVDEFIASHQSNSAADDQAIVDRMTPQGAAVDAISAKLA